MFEQVTGPEEPEEQKRTDWTGVIIFVALLPVLFFFRHIGKTDTGLNVSICLGVNLVVIRVRWNLKKYFWFWGVMALVLAIEMPLVVNVQWPRGWVPGTALLPIGFAGVLVAFGAIGLAENFIAKAPLDEEK